MAPGVKKLEGLAAVFSADRDSVGDLEERVDLSAVDPADLESFSDAGWQIVAEAVHAPQQRRVYQDEAGRVLIEGQYLTLKTSPGVTLEEVESLAGDYGLTVKRTLGMRRDTFQVAPVASPERPDPLEVCARLEEDERVRWVEPAFIEAIGRRDSVGPE